MFNFKIFFLFILISIFSYSQEKKKKLDGIVAMVGDEVLFYSELQENIMQYKSQTSSTLSDSLLSKQVLEELLFQKLLVYHAKIDSIEVSDMEVNNNLNRRLDYIISQIGSVKKVEKYFDKTIAQIKDELSVNIREQLTAQMMQQEITRFVDVTPSEISNYYEDIPKDSLPFIEDQFQIAQILILPNPSDSSILETKSKLNNLKERIESGDKFSTMAILYSEDPGSSRTGGEYFDVKKGQLEKKFESVIFSLSIGEISNVFKTDFGFHIAKLLDRKGGVVDFAHILMVPKIFYKELNESKNVLTSLKEDLNNGLISFETAARKYSDDDLTKHNGGLLINDQTGELNFFLDEIDPLIKQNIINLEEDDISDALYYKSIDGKEGYRLIKLVKKKDAHFANPTDDFNLIKIYAENNKKQNMLLEWINLKIKNTFIHIDEDFSDLDFNYEWNKHL
jgi:peptidyl-prolyl cis-trans isomerase SurA